MVKVCGIKKKILLTYPPPAPQEEYVLYTRLNVDNYGRPL